MGCSIVHCGSSDSARQGGIDNEYLDQVYSDSYSGKHDYLDDILANLWNRGSETRILDRVYRGYPKTISKPCLLAYGACTSSAVLDQGFCMEIVSCS